MNKEETFIAAAWVGVGIIVGFMAWTFLAPYLSAALPANVSTPVLASANNVVQMGPQAA